MPTIDDIDDLGILTRTLLGEARGEGVAGMRAVANVIDNRVCHACWWGNTFRTVCLDPYQFSCWNPDDLNYNTLLNFDETTDIYVNARTIAQQAMDGQLADITDGATNYYSDALKEKPFWAIGKLPCAVIGHHIFYKI